MFLCLNNYFFVSISLCLNNIIQVILSTFAIENTVVQIEFVPRDLFISVESVIWRVSLHCCSLSVESSTFLNNEGLPAFPSFMGVSGAYESI